MEAKPLAPERVTDGAYSPASTLSLHAHALGGAHGLRGSFAWPLAGNIVYMACQWLSVVLLARLGTVEMLGQFALALALATPLTLAANLYLRVVLSADVRGAYAFADYLGLRLLTTLIAGCCIFALALAGGFHGSTVWVLLIIGAAKAIDALSDLLLGLFQLRGRLDYLAGTLAINGIASLLALGLLLWWTHAIVWGALGSALGSTAALAAGCWAAALLRPPEHFSVRAIARFFRPRFHGPTLRRLALAAAPLGFASLRAVLSLNVPRQIIGLELGEHALGIFAALASLVVAGLVLTTALTMALTPRLAALYALGDRLAFRRLVMRLLVLAAAQCVLGVSLALSAGRPLLALVFGAEYTQYGDLLVWLSLTATLYAVISFLEMALMAMGRYTVQMQIQLIALAVLLGLCLWLTPAWGLNGAAIAMCAASLLSAAAYGLAVSAISIAGSAFPPRDRRHDHAGPIRNATPARPGRPHHAPGAAAGP